MIFLIEAVVLCLLFTALVVPSLYKDPLSWISDYPPAIRQRAKELGLVSGDADKMPPRVILRKLIASLAAAVIFSLLLVYVNGAETFLQGFLLSYGLWLAVDWYDALIIDCLWFCHSKRAVLPGTEDMQAAYRDYGFHIRMSGVGMLLGLPVCLLVGLLTMLFA